MSEIEEIKKKYDKMRPNTIENWIPLQDWWDDIQTLRSALKKGQEEIPVKCVDCGVCRRCDGRGEVYERVSTWWDDNADEHSDICPNCKGNGKR